MPIFYKVFTKSRKQTQEVTLVPISHTALSSRATVQGSLTPQSTHFFNYTISLFFAEPEYCVGDFNVHQGWVTAVKLLQKQNMFPWPGHVVVVVQ